MLVPWKTQRLLQKLASRSELLAILGSLLGNHLSARPPSGAAFGCTECGAGLHIPALRVCVKSVGTRGRRGSPAGLGEKRRSCTASKAGVWIRFLRMPSKSSLEGFAKSYRLGRRW